MTVGGILGVRPIRFAVTIAEPAIVTLVVLALLQTFVGRTFAVEQTSRTRRQTAGGQRLHS